MTLTSLEIAKAIQEGEILISLYTNLSHPIHVYARVDSGASMSSIDYKLFQMLHDCDGWTDGKPKFEYAERETIVKSSLGKEKRSVVFVEFSWNDSEFVMEMNSADRSKVSCPILLGRDWLGTN